MIEYYNVFYHINKIKSKNITKLQINNIPAI